MTIHLTPEQEQRIADAIRTGAYKNPDDVVSHALEILHSEGQWLRKQPNSIEAKIERAFAQFERGEFFSAEESRSNMEKRKAKWLADQHCS
jgi:Arc/MetJ-type ribon-helix-helix transcriptional regulator